MRIDQPLIRTHLLEVVMVIVVLAITLLFSTMPGYKLVILHLYFLPVALSGFFLGRYGAGTVAFLCIVSVAIVTAINLEQLSTTISPLIVVFSLGVWAAVLGLTSLLIGTLSDDRIRRLKELHVAHVNDTLSDALTNVANRRAFEYELARRMTEWSRQETPVSLILVDVDHFKKFNDVHGHVAGDDVLRGVAKVLEATMRDMDLVARYGGEEFAVILPNTGVQDVKEAAERARVDIANSRFQFEGSELSVMVSVGAANVMEGEDAESLVLRADAALYASKQAGRNCSHIHNGRLCEHFGAGLLSSAPSGGNGESPDPAIADVYTDPVTNLPVRRVFIEELQRRISEVRRYDAQLSIMLMEVYEFAQIKDRGPQAGERIIQRAAMSLRAALRDSDLVTRFGEDQFAVLLPATSLTDICIPAVRIHEEAEACEKINYLGVPLFFSVSIGLTELQAGDDVGSVLERAVEALKAASSTGQKQTYAHNGNVCVPVGMLPDIAT